MAREFTFGAGSYLPAEFLNKIQDLLLPYADSGLATYSTTEVQVQATVGDEVQIVIDGTPCVNATTVSADVDGGPSWIYNAYAIASLAPSSIASAQSTFYLAVSTQPPAGLTPIKNIGAAHWDGAEFTDFRQNARRLNVSRVGGSEGAPTGGHYTIPITRGDGTLHYSYLQTPDQYEAKVGDVIDWWIPPGAPSAIPTTWALLNGQVIPSGSHEFGPFDVTLPNYNDKMTLYANPSAPWGQVSQPSNTASAAPGIGGIQSTRTFTATSMVHAHSEPAHTHVATHRHLDASNHFHPIPSHTHPVNRGQISFKSSDTTRRWNFFQRTEEPETKQPINGQTQTPYFEANFTVNSAMASTGLARPSLMDSRPAIVGFLKLIKVRT